MEEYGHSGDGSSHSEPANAIEYVRSYTSAPVRRTVVLRKFSIPSSPLLHQCCGERAGQAEDQTEKPQHVDPDGGCCWFERLICLSCEVGERCPVGHVNELLSYLAEERIRCITGIGRQVLIAFDNERCDGGRKKTGLRDVL